ncbi:MAG: YicC family protein [Bacteroidales bacterium]|nr:YicC family protein [Bacteroidales bacterium]
MKSMTGFAKRQCNISTKKYTIEIKSLNSKQMDANVKLPATLKEYELAIRAMLNRLERGKIDFSISEEKSAATAAQLDTTLARQRFEELKSLASQLTNASDEQQLLNIVLSQPDVWTANEEEDISEEEWNALSDEISKAVGDLDSTRIHEGEILKADFVKHVALIEQYLNNIPQYESERIETAKERMRSMLNEAAIKEVDSNRFEQELIYYLEKLDITEEKVRLKKHIDYFREVMENEEGSGKKLGFIAQEMGREINTTGSKANHVEIQRLVVAMKDELEKIKEQLGNIL